MGEGIPNYNLLKKTGCQIVVLRSWLRTARTPERTFYGCHEMLAFDADKVKASLPFDCGGVDDAITTPIGWHGLVASRMLILFVQDFSVVLEINVPKVPLQEGTGLVLKLFGKRIQTKHTTRTTTIATI